MLSVRLLPRHEHVIFMNKLLWMIVACAILGMADCAIAQVPPSGFAPSSLPADCAEWDRPPEISPNAEQWRYSFQNGSWWYLTPERRWLYWSQGRWVEYLPPNRGNTPPYVQPPVPQAARWRPFGALRRRGTYISPNLGGPPSFGYPGYGVY
jgi:hypothetical protein